MNELNISVTNIFHIIALANHIIANKNSVNDMLMQLQCLYTLSIILFFNTQRFGDCSLSQKHCLF